jgi:hypothetical protein
MCLNLRYFIEPKQRAHSPLIVAGLASELKTDIIPYGRRFPVVCDGDLQIDIFAKNEKQLNI